MKPTRRCLPLDSHDQEINPIPNESLSTRNAVMSRLDVPHDFTQHFNAWTGTLELLQHIREGNRVDVAHFLEGRRSLSAADKQQGKAVNLVRSEWGKVRIERLGWLAEDIDLLLKCLEDRSCVVSGIAFS